MADRITEILNTLGTRIWNAEQDLYFARMYHVAEVHPEAGLLTVDCRDGATIASIIEEIETDLKGLGHGHYAYCLYAVEGEQMMYAKSFRRIGYGF